LFPLRRDGSHQPPRFIQYRGRHGTARRTLAGFEACAMIRKGQVRNIDGRDIRAQAIFIAGIFDSAAEGRPVEGDKAPASL
jgi:hypothetical protein